MLYSILLIAISLAGGRWLRPILDGIMPAWGQLLTTILTLTAMAPFLLALILPPPMNSSDTASRLHASQLKLLLLTLSRTLNTRLRNIEARFLDNLNERDLRRSGKNNTLVSDLHLAYIHVG